MAWVTRDLSGIWNLHGVKPAAKNVDEPWPIGSDDNYFSPTSTNFRGLNLKPGEGPIQVDLVRKVTKRQAKK